MMPYDAVKQGFQDLIHEDAEILLESSLIKIKGYRFD